jgi:hypothetical protein
MTRTADSPRPPNSIRSINNDRARPGRRARRLTTTMVGMATDRTTEGAAIEPRSARANRIQ